YNIRLPVTREDLIPLRKNIDVRLYALDRKAVAGTALRASITHFSPKHLTVSSACPVNQWEEVKIQVLDDNLVPSAGECYAKVISVKHAEGDHECLMRFTSLPAEVLQALRQAAKA
ncbi:MAG: hypothetical protein FJY85_21695, partial [Deltaproteobacteria bacterium]|nr:hypothetical protein [Deltaproteobacteria bacterium]